MLESLLRGRSSAQPLPDNRFLISVGLGLGIGGQGYTSVSVEDCRSLDSDFVRTLIRFREQLFAVLIVTDLLKPIDVLTVDAFLKGDVAQARVRSRTVPMLHARRNPYHVARLDFAPLAV